MVAEAQDLKKICETWLHNFAAAVNAEDGTALQNLFVDDCFWRDLVSFTWNIKTMEGSAAIADMVSATLGHVAPHSWQIQGNPVETDGITETWFTFETKHVYGKGFLRLRESMCWTLLTTAQALKGYEERVGRSRVRGIEHGPSRERPTWQENRELRRARLGHSEQPFVVIVGGGQGGIALAARLKLLDVPAIVLEKNARAGDSWRNRYKSLALHDPVWYDHMPFLPFPEHWPVFSPKDMLGDWLEAYVSIMDLDYWTNAACTSATYDDAAAQWLVHAKVDGKEMTLRPQHLVFATGLSGFANVPELPGMASFRGDVWHSSKHPGGDGYNGKKAVIVGSNNSAHDIAANLLECGVESVTMIQRSPTTVIKSATLLSVFVDGLYSEEALAKGITTDMADLMFASLPYRLLPALHVGLCDEVRKRDADFYTRLADAGFACDFGEDGSGLILKYLRRGSGYYIDVGASELVANGSIGVQSGQIVALSDTGVVMKDGKELDADLVVFATGYTSMNSWVKQLVSAEVADKVGKCWGVGSETVRDPGPWEGELRNMWKPTQQEGLWFHGGNLHQSRHYSQFLAVQLKARHAGLDIFVYGLQKSFHIS